MQFSFTATHSRLYGNPMPSAILALEDGRCFHGEAFGACGDATGEAVFNTSMTGYQEVLTDPSYRGQLVAMTYPLIGNYGISPIDGESDRPHVNGFIIGELSPLASNWRSRTTLDAFLKEWGVTGIQGIDTRALTKHLRQAGAMRAAIITSTQVPEEAVRLAADSPEMIGADYVREVTASQPYDWDPESSASGRWTIPTSGEPGAGTDLKRDALSGELHHPLPPARYRIVAYDFGIKYNILRQLRQEGFAVRVVPADFPATDVLALEPDGVFLSNGPGDPAALDYIHRNVRDLIGRTPLFGICLGHQILGSAVGGKTFKLKFGHHGGNQPVKDLRTGKVAITAQNHGFAVDPDSLPPEVEVTHLNLNDQTVEGIRHREHPVFSVQYHPEAAPGPHDAQYFFGEFSKLLDAARPT
jgi:carbamoyl-phosphate synthase small subunit